MPLACRQSCLSNRGNTSAVDSCKSISLCRFRHPRCQAQGTGLTDVRSTLVSRRLACLAPLIGFVAFTLRPPASSAAGIPSVLSQSLKKQLGGLWFADIPADLHICSFVFGGCNHQKHAKVFCLKCYGNMLCIVHVEPYLSAPAEFLRTRQRANGGEIILAPIRSSRQILEVRSVPGFAAYPALTSTWHTHAQCNLSHGHYTEVQSTGQL